MAVKNKTYSYHCVIALIAIALPLLISFTKKDNKPNLAGLVISDTKPEFTSKTWLDGSYQTEKEGYNNDHWAFKEKMVRINNLLYHLQNH